MSTPGDLLELRGVGLVGKPALARSPCTSPFELLACFVFLGLVPVERARGKSLNAAPPSVASRVGTSPWHPAPSNRRPRGGRVRGGLTGVCCWHGLSAWVHGTRLAAPAVGEHPRRAAEARDVRPNIGPTGGVIPCPKRGFLCDEPRVSLP